MIAVFSAQPECEQVRGTLTVGDAVPSSSIYSHPSYTSAETNFDIALIKLSGSAPNSYQLTSLSPWTPADVGVDKVLIAGYGVTAGPPVENDDGILLRATVLNPVSASEMPVLKSQVIAALSAEEANSAKRRKEIDDLFRIDPKSEWTLLKQWEGTGACHGDSGGPSYMSVSNQILQWGVISFGVDAKDQGCKLVGAWVNTKYYRPWIEQTFNQIKSSGARATPFAN
jgi:secreted trypsin-like serine protease